MKTAVQQAIIDLKMQKDILFQEGKIMTAMNVSLAARIVERYLQIEKEQIIDAYENGVGDENERNLSGKFTNAEEYYNQTYNQNK